MCGIVGIMTRPGASVADGALDRMMERIAHRGPDSDAIISYPEAGIHLGHTRLAIIDLSPAGAQPMTSACGRFTIVINGEIYNFEDIRREIDAHASIAWRGHSDTEVVLEAFALWGVEATLARMEGMFAFALWDRGVRELILARDRLGEKPLYMAHYDGALLFGSELGAIMAYPGFDGQMDDDAHDLFLALSYVPEPFTPFESVWKLPAGCLVRVRDPGGDLAPQVYWDAASAAFTARQSGIAPTEAKAAVERRLLTVIRSQMIADVPVGVFLSGGIDSSLVTALMQEQSSRPINTFTIGFDDRLYNEADDARRVAEHLGTHHTEVMLNWQDALDLVETLPTVYSEPFADSSQLPTLLVSQVARRSVTVALSGDGGDEVFAGYNRHVFAWRQQRLLDRMPRPVLAALGAGLARIGKPRHSGLLERLVGLLGKRGFRLPAEKIGKLAAIINAPNDLQSYGGLVRRDDGAINESKLFRLLAKHAEAVRFDDQVLPEFMMLMDARTYLCGDILHKVDRASMSVALETRAPYLDHRLFEAAWAVPINEHLASGQGKSLLRQMLAKRVPAALFERPKAGFGVPIDLWLRKPLRDWMEDLTAAYRRAHPRHDACVAEACRRFIEGDGHLHHFIWNVLMWQAWAEQTSVVQRQSGQQRSDRRAAV